MAGFRNTFSQVGGGGVLDLKLLLYLKTLNTYLSYTSCRSNLVHRYRCLVCHTPHSHKVEGKQLERKRIKRDVQHLHLNS